MGGTKESATEAPEKYKLGKPMTSGIVNIHLSPRERALTSQQYKRGRAGQGRAGQGPQYYVMVGYMDT